MNATIVAMYDQLSTVYEAVQDLTDKGFRRDDISLVANDAERKLSASIDVEAPSVGKGTDNETILGGVAGVLIGLGALAIPGVGPIIAAGPLAATLAGAGVGAVTGGLVGALVEAGVPEYAAQFYAEGVRRGGTIVTVRVSEEQARMARDVLTHHGAADIQSRADEWRRSGWHEVEGSADEPPEAPFATSPMQIDEQIGPERADSVYGGAEHAPGLRAGTKDVSETEAPAEQPTGHPSEGMGSGEQGLGLSSGAGQVGGDSPTTEADWTDTGSRLNRPSYQGPEERQI